jgi:hypothetical protein
MMKYRVITFADGHSIWRRSLRRFSRQSHESNYFSRLEVYDLQVIAQSLGDFFAANKEFMVSSKRGFGYWIWKPEIIRHALDSLSEDEGGVVYLDVGCSLNFSESSKKRFEEYIKISEQDGSVFFQLKGDNKIRDWTKRDLVEHFDFSEAELESNLIAGGILFFSKSAENKQLLSEWSQLMSVNGHHLVDDSSSVFPESGSFKEHRHDQAILTGLALRRGLKVIPDETYSEGNWKKTMQDFPIWATRLKSGFDSTSSNFFMKVVRKIEWFVTGIYG